jgi:hypothetical protein
VVCCAPEPVWTQRIEEKSFASAGRKISKPNKEDTVKIPSKFEHDKKIYPVYVWTR